MYINNGIIISSAVFVNILYSLKFNITKIIILKESIEIHIVFVLNLLQKKAHSEMERAIYYTK